MFGNELNTLNNIKQKTFAKMCFQIFTKKHILVYDAFWTPTLHFLKFITHESEFLMKMFLDSRFFLLC